MIHRFSLCGASLDFDPYLHEVPAADCDIDEDNDFIVRLSAIEQGHRQVDVAVRWLREYSRLEDVYIWPLFKDTLKYHGDNSLHGFREKQLMMTLYARYHETLSANGRSYETDEDYIRPGFHLNPHVFIRLNAANARFYYFPFEKRRVSV